MKNSAALHRSVITTGADYRFAIRSQRWLVAQQFSKARTCIRPRIFEGSSAIGLHLGDDVDGGVVVGGRLLQGERGSAGAFAHLAVDVEGRPCVCGKSGCLDSYASVRASKQQPAEGLFQLRALYHPVRNDGCEGMCIACRNDGHSTHSNWRGCG